MSQVVMHERQVRQVEQLASGALVHSRYEVLRILGRGGMATAYLVRDHLWDVDVALKLLRASSSELLAALHFEFAVLRELCHPSLCQVHDFSLLEPLSDAGEYNCFYTADSIPGGTLEQLARGASWQQVLRPLCDALSALRLLHRAGIRHGDFKPTNILVRPDGSGVLIDLGCARPVGVDGSGKVSGTVEFMAPELLSGEPADHRADLFALGVTLRQVGQSCAEGPPRPVKQLGLRLVRPDPRQRPADVDEVLEALGVAPTFQAAVPDGMGKLVGRAKPLAQARSALQALVGSNPSCRLLHLSGGEGVGKSRLLREIKWEAQHDCRVLETNTARPGAITELLRRLADLPEGSGLDALLAVRERFSSERERPTVLLIDDAHRLEQNERELLLALTRSLGPSDPLLVVTSSLPEQTWDSPNALCIELGPLRERDVHEWLGRSLPERVRASLHSLSGGIPAALHAVLAQLASGAISQQQLTQKRARRVPLSRRRRELLSTLGEAEQSALGMVAILGRPISGTSLQQLGVNAGALDSLLVQGLLGRDAAVYKLSCPGESEQLLESLDSHLVRQLHLRAQSWLSEQVQQLSAGDPRRSELNARRVGHLALGGQVEQARSLLLESSPQHEVSPLAWWQASETLASVSDDPELALQTAALERCAGRASAAKARLTKLLGQPHPASLESRLHLELGLCHLKLGEAESARQQLDAALESAPDAQLGSRVRAVLAQSLTKQGSYREALQLADEALAAATEPVVCADLQQTAGVALSFLGRPHEAQERLQQALALLRSVDHPRRLVRTQGTQGLVAYEVGDLAAATEHYREALELAERHELSDQVATAALNYGTVCHQRADWASALSAYERGLLTAAALGQTSTEALLRFDLAKLYADLGQFERAELAVDRCQKLAGSVGLPLVAAEAEAVKGEIRAAQDQVEGARACWEQARQQFGEHESVRESTEVGVHLAELALASGDVDGCDDLLDECQRHLATLDARDVKLRWSLARVRLLLARSQPREAATEAEAALHQAHEIGLGEAEAEAQMLLAQAWDALASPFLANKYRAAAREIWERAAASLAVGLREAFWRHPKRIGARQVETAETPTDATGREQKLRLLLDINKRLNSSLKTSEILKHTMDAAIQLTGAERGFVLLIDAGQGKRPLRVAVARNLDREQLDRSHLKFSRAIAEQVIADGTPVMTANAQTDARFSQHESVHAMHLQSVVCVPVLSPSGTLGALYLDNRFQPDRFREQDVELLLAFSDQVAIALDNARLHDELKRRNRELSRQRERVEQLLRGQAEEIDRLNEAMRKGHPPPERRYDYRSIVGSSPPMHRVFALLDRVIETDLPILIQGESGTGKELFARAIHENNRDRKGPLVSVNCAALPETLLESELFGYERGAFTGADRSRDGLLVRARGGTLLLDEVAEMPLPMQVKLLRALQEREVRPLGSHKVIAIDIRLVCATNRRLQDEVREGRFRADLYYRVAGVEMTLPPLRERTEDIPLLVHHLLSRAAERMGRGSPEVTGQALRKLVGFPWPGNVRQLENVVTKALVLSEGDRITASDIELPDEAKDSTAGLDRTTFMRQEAQRIADALAANRYNVAKVSRLLGIPRPTLYRKLRRYGIGREA
jgi:serine/threonine-protein kinase PknK